MQRNILAALVAGVICAAGTASGQDNALALCRSDDTPSSDRIAACTAEIASGDLNVQNRAVAFYNRGQAYMLARQASQALADEDQAIKLEPDYVDALLLRAGAHGLLLQFDLALPDFQRAIDLDPANARALSGRGLTYETLGQLANAIADFGSAIKLDPDDAFSYRNRGMCYLRLGQNDRALQNFEQALTLRPDDANNYAGRASFYMVTGQFDRAIADLDQAVQHDPDPHFAAMREQARQTIEKVHAAQGDPAPPAAPH